MANLYAAQKKLRAFDALLDEIVRAHDRVLALDVVEEDAYEGPGRLKHAQEDAANALSALIEQARNRNRRK